MALTEVRKGAGLLTVSLVALALSAQGMVFGQTITLDSPADEATLASANPAKFKWELSGSLDDQQVEFSSDAEFACGGKECLLVVGVKRAASKLKLKKKLWRKLLIIARLNDDVVNWRVTGNGQTVLSSVRSFTVPPTTLELGDVDDTEDKLTLGYTASGVEKVYVDISASGFTRKVTTVTVKGKKGAAVVEGSDLDDARAMLDTGDVYWRARGRDSATRRKVMTEAQVLWAQAAAADAGDDVHDAGYGKLVALDGSGSEASPGGGALTYSWAVTGGHFKDDIVLTGADTATPSFTTPAAQEVLDTNDKDSLKVVDVSPNDADITLTLTVTDEATKSDTDTVTVHLSHSTSGLQNVPIGELVALNAPASVVKAYAWTLDVPVGSGAVLLDATTQNPSFIPDVPGTYVATETEADPDQVLTINAGTWVGVENNCRVCHAGGLATAPDKYADWAATGHADMLERRLNTPGYYKESCIECHTLGYNEQAVNDGFDDVADAIGWEFPGPGPGHYDALPDRLKNLANIQCENCHGPGSQHFGEVDAEQTSISFNVGVCATCHDAGSHHIRPRQWRYSAHSNPPYSASSSCAACHTGQGFAQKMAGETVTTPTNPEPQTCACCHDPHDATNEHQLRKIGDVTFPNGFVAAGGKGTVCLECHSGRRNTNDAATLFDEKRAPHHNVQGAVLLGTNLFEFIAPYTSSAHTYVVKDRCVDCHMAASPSGDAHYKVGDHSFNVSWHDEAKDGDVENLASCNVEGCHSADPLTSFDRAARADYDGDGNVEGVMTEVDGLVELLTEAINLSLGDGVNPGGFYSYHGRLHFTDENGLEYWGDEQNPSPRTLTQTQFQVTYNLLVVEYDHSHGIHNTGLAVQALQRSYEALTGNRVPGADIRK